MIDISDLAESNRRYAIHLATKEGIVSFQDGLFNLERSEADTSFSVVDFYRDVALACELLLKACLLRHRINFFKRREGSEYGDGVSAASNPWMQSLLGELNITRISQINTGTAATTLKVAEKALFDRLHPEQAAFISKSFYIIIRTRRNRTNHFYFPNMAYLDIPEVEMLYLPLLNVLQEIYVGEELAKQ